MYLGMVVYPRIGAFPVHSGAALSIHSHTVCTWLFRDDDLAEKVRWDQLGSKRRCSLSTPVRILHASFLNGKSLYISWRTLNSNQGMHVISASVVRTANIFCRTLHIRRRHRRFPSDPPNNTSWNILTIFFWKSSTFLSISRGKSLLRPSKW